MYHELGLGPFTYETPPPQTVPWNVNLPVPTTTTPRTGTTAAIDAAGGILRGVLDLFGSARRKSSTTSQPAPQMPAPAPTPESFAAGVSPMVIAGGLALLAVLLLRD